MIILAEFICQLTAYNAAQAAEYDPMNTMLALNMAIVSVNRIVTTQDRIVLDQEYKTIMNRLAIGNIEDDTAMTGLYEQLMNFISSKGLRQDEAKRFQEKYNRREQRQLAESISSIRAYGGSLWSFLGSLATSCVSAYFGYNSAKDELREGLDDELWQLKREDVEDCNELQTQLLTSSWNLLRQYKLPDDYRLTQESMSALYKAEQERHPDKRLRMLKAIYRSFKVYPPYWFARARAAQESGNAEEALECFDKFDEVWRPVLRFDPYKLEAAKWRIQNIAKDGAPAGAARDEIKKQLELMREYTSEGDWGSNLFAGVAYFALGDKDEAIMCVEPNVDFAYETDVNGIILAQMKAGKLEADVIAQILNPKETEASKHNEHLATEQGTSRRRVLTIDDLVRVGKKYGFVTRPNDPTKYASDIRFGYFMGIGGAEMKFDKDGVYFDSGGVARFNKFISYNDLRNNPKFTFSYLRDLLKKQPREHLEAVLELKEMD